MPRTPMISYVTLYPLLFFFFFFLITHLLPSDHGSSKAKMLNEVFLAVHSDEPLWPIIHGPLVRPYDASLLVNADTYILFM